MGDNGQVATAEKPRIQWLKGKMRTEVQASECGYLRPNMGIEINLMRREVEVSSELALPGGARPPVTAIETVRVINGPLRNQLFCFSPEIRRRLLDDLPSDLAAQAAEKTVVTTLEFCRLCPFYARQQ